MDLLARREHASRELSQKLQRRFSSARSASRSASRSAFSSAFGRASEGASEGVSEGVSESTAESESEGSASGRIAELVENVVETLRHEGLQSDRRLAEVLIRSRAGRGQGPLKIKSELRAKGVADNTIAEAFEESGIDWFENVANVARKRFGDAPPADAKERAKRSRFLQQRGFSFDEIGTLD
jgi:regulatory protein